MLDYKLSCEIVTYALVTEFIAINVKDRQNKNIHLVEQTGHLGITAIGGQSLRKIAKMFSAVIRGSLVKNARRVSTGVLLTSLTNHWQKAGAIHSLAWIPQSMKIAGLEELDFFPT